MRSATRSAKRSNLQEIRETVGQIVIMQVLVIAVMVDRWSNTEK